MCRFAVRQAREAAEPVAAKRRAFTVVELLVVIGIIALLLSILVPVTGRVRRQNEALKCANNMRQVVMALTSYAQEHDNTYPLYASVGAGPTASDWLYWQELPTLRDINASPTAPYLSAHDDALKAIFRCPGDSPDDASLHPVNGTYGAYRYSFTLSDYTKNASLLITVVNPSHKILLAEEDRPDDGHWVPSGNPIAGRHNGFGNVGYYDGHVALITNAEVAADLPGYSDPTAP